MKKLAMGVLVALLVFASGRDAAAHTTYVGYSGAPGSKGTCATSCHGSAGGTVQISGFPAAYAPDSVYTVSVTHNGGATIRQFNGSCRIGTGSQNAGAITAGTNTTTYVATGETNGVHLTTADLNAATFVWTAPHAGAGGVTLYVGGHQGTYSGANTTIVLTATEQITGIDGGAAAGSAARSLIHNYPNPFPAQTVIEYAVPQATSVLLEIYNAAGRRIEFREMQQRPGRAQFTWNASAYPAGAYFCKVRAGTVMETKKLLLSK